ncbi:MAG: signal peptidase II, partial [Ginsengibacter sp.]
MKGRTIFIIICLIVLADQALKIYIKTNYYVGESHSVIGQWFRLYFIENEGMAYGWKFGGEWGKMILTLFRMGAVIFGVFYIRDLVKKKYHKGF